MAAIEGAYGNSGGPDYLEVSDYRGHGLVPLQARRAGHPLLRKTLVGVRLASTTELICLHDAVSNEEMRYTADLEREQFRLADRVLWRGGDTLSLYRRYYSTPSLPQAVLIRPPLRLPKAPPRVTRRDPNEPLRLLYVGRLQQFKRPLDLVEACLRLPRDDWQLTLIGGDTQTAPTEQSMRATIETVCDGDPRIRIEGQLSYGEVQRRWDQHDLLVVSSAFEVWGNAATEAMRNGLPILATPVGGLAEIVEHGVTGWHTEGLGPKALGRALADLLEHREEIEEVRSSGAIFERLRKLTDNGQTLGAYESMISSARVGESGRAQPLKEPSVTGVVPYHRARAHIEEAVRSLLQQSHRNLDVVIVNDGSFQEEDRILDRIAADPRVSVITQLNQGESAARNLGARVAGGEFVVMLDADNLLEPEFVSRALGVLRREPGLAYVTSWLEFIDRDGEPMSAGYAPLGNSVIREDSANWDGDTIAVLPRRLFTELGYGFEVNSVIQCDWELYRTLRADGRFGAVIPEQLAKYRVHGDSLMRSLGEATHSRSWTEARARLRMAETTWTAEMRG
ncbi:MAG: glycosyltransferase [Solirubrobacterales bacterium]